MAASSHFKDRHAEGQLFGRRLMVATVLVVIMTLTLATRMIWLQWLQHAHFQDLSNSNRIQTQPITPPRGLILDRDGRILAANRPDISVDIVPEQVKNMDDTLAAIGKLITLSADDIDSFRQRLAAPRHPFEPIPLRSRLTQEEVARLAASEFRLPGVHLDADALRYYPYGDLLSHSVGYVSRISAKDLQAMTPEEQENYNGTHYYGRTGLERYYESLLHGKVGYRKVEVNARGRILKIQGETPPVRGENLQLYLDLDVQQAAWDAMGDQHGAVIAIDPRSGGVLALVSRPGFDPNMFVTGISYKDYQALRQDPGQPLFNRALQGQYPPGSTIKPFMGLAGLAYHATNWQKTIFDPGYFQLPGVSRRYRDWKHSGHGIVNLTKAIQVSCDTYFYTLGYKLGINHIDAFLSHFKFGEATGIDLYGEANGILPSPAWKKKRYGHPWYDGDTVNASIGQGYVLVTPLQLATAAAILSRDGHTMSPRLADIKGHEQPPVGGEPLLDDATDWKRMRRAMVSVTEGAQGTARYISHGAKYAIAGKTGTAQVFSLNGAEYDRNMVPKRLRDHSLFIGFAPADDPAIVVAVLLENAAHDNGPSAALVARKVMDSWLLDKAGELNIPQAEPQPITHPLDTRPEAASEP
jgi:penicillin-binding protein 2